MKQTVEEAAKSFANKKWPDLEHRRQAHLREYAENDFKAGAEWAAPLPTNSHINYGALIHEGKMYPVVLLLCNPVIKYLNQNGFKERI